MVARLQVGLRRGAVLARALASQAAGPAPTAPAAMDLRPCAAALRDQGGDAVVVRVDARSKPWTAAGVEVLDGGAVTWLAHGDSWAFGRRGPHFDAAMQLRVRAGAGPSLMGTGPTHSSPARSGGAVELCCIWPAELVGPEERVVYDRRMPRSVFGGGFDVVAAAWPPRADVRAALEAAAEHDPTGLCRHEAARQRAPLAAPAGWDVHPMLPLRGLHTSAAPGIAVSTHGDVEIIRREVRVPLTPTLGLRWRWRMHELPSALAEDTLLTHDYLSVAVEFDDGKDLTYYWSAGLPAGSHYACPLPHWRQREWHMVIRSGSVGLGEWQEEQRVIAPDRDAAIGGPRPSEVVRVWLIATSVAQQRRGAADYADIELIDGAQSTPVLV